MRVPLVVVTGFLGAGKTTLINRLLARRAKRHARGKLGVIVNELGAIGIDGALLGGETAKQIELPGGCVCCVLGDELDRTLLELCERNPELEAIVLETTGVAEPLPIAWAVRRDPVAQRVRLAAVVTLVDAENFIASRAVSPAADAQVAYADVLLLTKPEQAGEAKADSVERLLREIAPRRVLLLNPATARGSIDDHAAALEQLLADPRLERVADDEASHEGHDHGVGEECRESGTHGVDSIALEISGVLDLEELEDQLAALPASYIRIKGIARAVDERRVEGWFAFHRVGLRVSSEPLEQRPEGFSGTAGRIVALGTDLDANAVTECVNVALHARSGSS
ncbi:MAG: cobalamin synthesis protein [Myxococcales bacterium]|nr:cobalamin synthesis protein [Myxococcales bacterium]